MCARVLAVLCVAAWLGAGCSGDDKKTEPDPSFPYTVPVAASMTADVSALLEEGSVAPSGLCHATAAVLVIAVNLNVAVRLAVPSLALAACASQQPVYAGNQTWRWTAAGGAGQGAWTAELTGAVTGESQVDWEMRVSGTELALDRFLWFHGNTDGLASQGVWHCSDAARASQPTEIAECTWSLPASGPRNVAFENTDPGVAEEGDRLNYILDGSTASVDYYDASLDQTAHIGWDVDTGAGSLIGFEGNRCCWGASPVYAEVDCPR